MAVSSVRIEDLGVPHLAEGTAGHDRDRGMGHVFSFFGYLSVSVAFQGRAMFERRAKFLYYVNV